MSPGIVADSFAAFVSSWFRSVKPRSKFSVSLLIALVFAACTPAPEITEPATLPTRAVLETAEAGLLEPWIAADGEIAAAESHEDWQFFGRAGDNIRLRVVSTEMNATMVLSQGETVLAEGDAIETSLPEDGLYSVIVTSVDGSSGTYQIGLGYTDQPNPYLPTEIPQVVGVPTPTPPLAAPGEFIGRFREDETTGGLLTTESPQHVYTFQGAVGDVVTIELYRLGGTLDPVLTLYSPSGDRVAMDDNSLGDSNARLLNIRLPEDGLYSIQVDGKGFFGDYTISFATGQQELNLDAQPTLTPTQVEPLVLPTFGPVVNDSRLLDHAPIVGNIPRAGDFMRFSFEAQAGEPISIRAQPYQESQIFPQVEVFDPDGNLLISARSSSDASRVASASGVPAEVSGVYVIIITGENSSTGPFTLSYGRGVTVENAYQGFAIADEPASGTINEIGMRHLWELSLDPGDSISIAVSPVGTGGIDPVVELVTAEGVVLYRDYNSGANGAALIGVANITAPATYLLRVYDAQGTGFGAYTLIWRFVNAAPTPTPIPDSLTILAVNDAVPPEQYHFYVFQGRAGQNVLIEVLAADDSPLDPVAALLDPEGEILAEGDDSNGTLDARFRATLPEDGTYTVRINGYLSSGAFDLFVRLLE